MAPLPPYLVAFLPPCPPGGSYSYLNIIVLKNEDEPPLGGLGGKKERESAGLGGKNNEKEKGLGGKKPKEEKRPGGAFLFNRVSELPGTPVEEPLHSLPASSFFYPSSVSQEVSFFL
jgi:hypothetical protein